MQDKESRQQYVKGDGFLPWAKSVRAWLFGSASEDQPRTFLGIA